MDIDLEILVAESGARKEALRKELQQAFLAGVLAARLPGYHPDDAHAAARLYVARQFGEVE